MIICTRFKVYSAIKNLFKTWQNWPIKFNHLTSLIMWIKKNYKFRMMMLKLSWHRPFLLLQPFWQQEKRKKRKQEKTVKKTRKKRDNLQDGHSWLVFGTSGDSRGDFFHDWASVPLQLAPTTTTLPHITILPHQLHRITVTHYNKTTPHTTTLTKPNYHTAPQSQSVITRATQQ